MATSSAEGVHRRETPLWVVKTGSGHARPFRRFSPRRSEQKLRGFAMRLLHRVEQCMRLC